MHNNPQSNNIFRMKRSGVIYFDLSLLPWQNIENSLGNERVNSSYKQRFIIHRPPRGTFAISRKLTREDEAAFASGNRWWIFPRETRSPAISSSHHGGRAARAAKCNWEKQRMPAGRFIWKFFPEVVGGPEVAWRRAVRAEGETLSM